MAKIELAYSLELGKVLDAMEANELWLEGRLKDKRAFECIDNSCDAKITCKNMDTFADKRKVNPHFIMANRENMHSLFCEVYKEYEEKDDKREKNRMECKKNTDIGRRVCFHLERPENHRIIKHKDSIECINNEIEYKEEKKRAVERRKNSQSNYYWLNSLIWYYIRSYKENTTDKDVVEIDFGKGRKYPYPLNKLFKRINNEAETTDKDKNHYVYYGKGRVYLREDGGYDLVFSEKFNGSEKRVKCVIGKKMIEGCQYGKASKVNILNASRGKERFIYVLSSKNIDKKYDRIYLNIEKMDCIAISEIDLDEIGEI
ncbi:MAG: hypothetical protein IJD40_10910 [Lachnospiraceae bacterium]|nr:hypothetical protein [Lachnospiraceae bacterium]